MTSPVSERPFLRVLVTGSTTWDKPETVRRALSQLPPHSVIVTGDTPGADACAMAVATGLGLTVQRMKKNRADQRAFPGEAWRGLNERMLATGIDLVLAFHADYGKPGCARGTVHMVELAGKSATEVRIFRA
ncbi:SLOG family protein [Massilia scottii]|uniref:SLOG family protein n=1 Tax=Massilia scottii TaxID=3057166 RepID=UPI002796DF7F|nr:SLOG family protein [Massilia sp. CCM 9029]MDQ1830847.1 SLOG family protein [Massilia sp. CCM 9029]